MKKNSVVATGAFSFSLEHPGLYIVYGIANIGTTVEELEAALEAEFDRVKNEQIR
ncbi:MAG: hypothetical protein R2728_15365 [Chitinophagales bacterium]